MMMLRARVGSMFGYDFKEYVQDVDITLYEDFLMSMIILVVEILSLLQTMGKLQPQRVH